MKLKLFFLRISINKAIVSYTNLARQNINSIDFVNATDEMAYPDIIGKMIGWLKMQREN